MGTSLLFIFLIIVAAIIAGLLFTGTGAALWSKKTAPPESPPNRDTAGEEDPASGTRGTAAESTVAPDARGIHHRESR